MVSNRFQVHRGFGDSGLYNTKRRVWRKPRRGSPPFTQNFNPGPVPKSPCVCCMCVLCCQQTLFEGCYLLDSSAPICTSNPLPTDSDRIESKYKFKTYTFGMVFICLWIYFVPGSFRRHEPVRPLKKKCCLCKAHTRTNKKLAGHLI